MPGDKREAILEKIKECLGEAQATYAGNKNRGGASGRKGTRYEDFFMAWKVAETAAEHVADPNLEWPYLEGQSAGFVDDVVVRGSAGTAYYQCKNADSVSWSSGEHPIASDFEMQKKLADYLKVENPTTGLVVARAELHEKLAGAVPESVAGHTSVHLFPYYEGSINRLVYENSELRETLSALAKVENPKLDELVGVLAALLASCVEHQSGCSADIILQFANTINPAQLRTVPANVDWAKELDPEFVSVLAKIEGLRYGANRGFFHWSAFGMSGVFDVSCADEKFKALQQQVIANKPATVEELETYLP
jgi:hypothetical protein